MAKLNIEDSIEQMLLERESLKSKSSPLRVKERQIGRVLKKLGMFHLTDRSANLVIAYFARLHTDFKSRLVSNVQAHTIAYQYLDYFLTKHALIYRNIPNEEDLEAISRELTGNLDKSPLAAMLLTQNSTKSLPDESWQLLQYYSAVASVSLLVSHVKFISAKGENVLMPAIAAGLRRVRLSQSKTEYSLMLPDLELNGSIQDFVENWRLFNEKVNSREGNAEGKNLSETVAYQRSGPLQNLIHKFWENVSSQPNYDREYANNRRSQMRFSLTKTRPVRMRTSFTRRKSDKRDGEEVAIEQRSDFDIFESEANHSHAYRSNNYARQKQAGAILARNVRAELGIPAIPQLLSLGHMKLLLEALELQSENSKHYQVDAWIFLIIYLSQTYEVLIKAYSEKKYKQDELNLALSRFRMRYKIERNLSSHIRVERLGLLENRENSLDVCLPSSLINHHVFPQEIKNFPSEKAIHARLQDICASVQISRVSINQLAAWQFLHLSRTWAERCEAAVVTGFQPNDWTPLNYCSINTSTLQHRHAEEWANITYETGHWKLANDFENLCATDIHKPSARYGSTLRLQTSKLELLFSYFRNYIAALKSSIVTQLKGSIEQVAELKTLRKLLHNAYTVYVLLMVKMLTGIRPIRSYFSSVSDFDFINNRVYINDKQRREGMARVVPMCIALKSQLTEYFAYLGAIIVEPDSQPANLVHVADLICRSEAEPFQIYSACGLQSVTPSSLEAYLRNLFPVPLNFARHVLRSWLYENASLNSVIIDDFMSHDIEGQMSQGLYSAYCSRDEFKLCQALDCFSRAMNLVVEVNPIQLQFSVEMNVFTSLPDLVHQRTVKAFEKVTERARRLKKVIQRQNRIEKKVHAFISQSCPELAMGEGTNEELDVYVNKVLAHINNKYQQAEYYLAMRYLMKTCDLVNAKYGRAINLPRLPVKLTREAATRDSVSVSSAQRAAIVMKTLSNLQFSLVELTDLDLRCLLVLMTVVQSSQNSADWLQILFAQGYSDIKLKTSIFNDAQLVWLPMKISETSVVNDLRHQTGAVHLEYIFLTGLQTGIVLELLKRKSKAVEYKLGDIPALLRSSESLHILSHPFFTLGDKPVAVATLFKFAVDAVAHECRDYSFALRHTSNGMIETYSIPEWNFEYLLHPVLNEVVTPPSLLNIGFDINDHPDIRRVKRKHVKQAIGMDALGLFHSLNKLFNASSKLSKNQVVKELDILIAKFVNVDAVVYLLNWFIYHLKVRKNAISSVRRYHSAITLNWLMVTVVIDDLRDLSGADFHDLYRQAIELTQDETDEDIEISVGAHEKPASANVQKGLSIEQRAKEKKRNSERHVEQIQRDKNAKAHNYLCETFGRLHNFFVSEYEIVPLDAPLKSQVSRRKEHVRAGYIPFQLYQEILVKLPSTTGCDDDTKFALKVITILAYRTAMRVNEILTLTIKDVTTIKERWLRLRNNPFGQLKSISSCRDIAIFSLLLPDELDLFNQWVQRRVVRSKKSNELLFCDADSPRKVWPEWMIKQSVVAWMRDLSGHSNFTFHHFRHSALSNLQLLVENEVDLFCYLTGHNEQSAKRIIESTLGGMNVRIDHYYALAMVAGHTSPKTTFKSYLHLSALLRHIKISSHHWHYKRSEVKMFSGLSDKQIAHLCLPWNIRERNTQKRVRRNSDYVEADSLLRCFVRSNKTLFRAISCQPGKTVQSATHTLLFKTSASDVHDILQEVVKGKSNNEISQLYQVDEELIKRYREQARKLLKVKTLVKNRRLISKRDEAKSIYLPLKPYSQRERDIARRIINKMIDTPSPEDKNVVLSLADYFIENIHPDESGVRFRDAARLNWFVDAMRPYVSLKSWFIFIVARKTDRTQVLEFIDEISITTKRPILKEKLQGHPEYYLRLKNPTPDRRKKNASFQSTSLLKYVFAMTTIMIRAEDNTQSQVEAKMLESEVSLAQTRDTPTKGSRNAWRRRVTR